MIDNRIAKFVFSFEGVEIHLNKKISGDDALRDTPVPIPNTTVKT